MATYTNAIQQLYVAYFNRPADPDGLAFWEGVVTNAGGDTSIPAAAFAATPEYEAVYGDKTNTQVVTAVYLNLFGRAPDAAGLAFWVNALDNDLMTVDLAVTTIAAGAVNADGTPNADGDIFANKVAAATAFTAAIDTDAEKAGYAGDDALALAKAFITGIKTDAQLEAAIAPAALNASVAAVVAAGTPFTLAGGLAALTAAQDAKADFLADALDNDTVAADVEATAADPDEPTADEIEASIGTVSAAADITIDAAIGSSYAAESASVRAAKVALLEAQQTEALTTATADMATAQEAVDEMAGLAAAIAELEAATEAAADAVVAADLAAVAVTTAEGTFNAKNANDLVFDAVNNKYTVNAVDVVVENADGEFEVADGVDADDYEGLTAFVTALNAQLAADATVTATAEAEAIATLNVDYMDALEANEALYEAVADAFVFQTPAIEDKASAAEIAAELEMFAQLMADLDEAAVADTVNGPYADYAAALADFSAELLASGTASDAAAITARAKAAGYITSADKVAIDAAGFGAAAQAKFDDNNWAVRDAALTDAEADLRLAEEGIANDLVDDLDAAAVLVDNAETAISDLADALEEFNAVEEIAAGLEAQNDAINASIEAFEDNDFAAPIIVDGIKFGTGADDVFVASSSDAEIKSFSVLGEDTLYIGTGFTMNASGDLDEGVDTVKEVFFVEDGADTIVYLETSVFGSSAATPEVVAITLTGVAAEDLVLSNGFITIA